MRSIMNCYMLIAWKVSDYHGDYENTICVASRIDEQLQLDRDAATCQFGVIVL